MKGQVKFVPNKRDGFSKIHQKQQGSAKIGAGQADEFTVSTKRNTSKHRKRPSVTTDTRERRRRFSGGRERRKTKVIFGLRMEGCLARIHGVDDDMRLDDREAPEYEFGGMQTVPRHDRRQTSEQEHIERGAALLWARGRYERHCGFACAFPKFCRCV